MNKLITEITQNGTLVSAFFSELGNEIEISSLAITVEDINAFTNHISKPEVQSFLSFLIGIKDEELETCLLAILKESQTPLFASIPAYKQLEDDEDDESF